MPDKALLTISFFLPAYFAFAQSDSIKYTKDFVFKDGIYVTIDDLKKNNPNLIPENFTKYNPETEYLDKNFFENTGYFETGRRKIFYPDSAGNVQEQTIDSLFGYAKDGRLFIIKHNDIGIGFRVLRTLQFGTICFCFEVSANSTTNEQIVPGVKVRQTKMGHNSLVPGSDRSRYQNSPKVFPSLKNPNEELGLNRMPIKAGQYLMDFKTGKIRDFRADNFEMFLKVADDDLYKEFSKLSPPKKKKMMFVYLNKVNEKHPVYFKN